MFCFIPTNHCPPHSLSLEQALECPGFSAAGHLSWSRIPQTTYRFWLPVPQCSEQCDHSVTNQAEVECEVCDKEETVTGGMRQGPMLQYSLCGGLSSDLHLPEGHVTDLVLYPVSQVVEHCNMKWIINEEVITDTNYFQNAFMNQRRGCLWEILCHSSWKGE